MHVVLGRVIVRSDSAAEWEAKWSARAEGARQFPGGGGAELLMPVDHPDERVIVGWWTTRENFDHWRASPDWEASEQQLQKLQGGAPEIHWYELRSRIELEHSGGTSPEVEM
jgi:heme-degrading monooxygenase HmoA